MAEAHPPGDHAHHGPTFQLYMMVAGALAVFTGLSFLFNWMARDQLIGVETSFVLILGVAVCKAVLVGMFFMHLKYEWGKLYFMIVPAFILGAMMAFVLLPDIVICWQPSKQPLEPPLSTSGTR
jgi:cytochrome c oxidase subunit 4